LELALKVSHEGETSNGTIEMQIGSQRCESTVLLDDQPLNWYRSAYVSQARLRPIIIGPE
jgi:hypothetical protein